MAAAVLMPARPIQEQYIRWEPDCFRLSETLGASGAATGLGRTLAAAWAEVGRGVAIDAQECRSGRRAGQDCCEWGFTLRDVGALLAR